MSLTRSMAGSYIRAPKTTNTGPLTRSLAGDIKNNGSGLAYLGKKSVVGLASVGEGITDLVGALAAEIRGDHAYAQYLFQYSDVKDWEEEFTREYNPTGTMAFLGDVSSAVGQTLGFVGIGAVGTAVGAPWLGTVGIVASSMGRGVSNAVQKTGKLGFSEYGYGLTMGALEGVLEAKLGVGMKTVGNLVSGGTAATGRKLLGRAIGRSYGAKLGIHIFSDGIEEAAEELISAAADPLVQRAFGVDPNATFNAKDAWRSAAIGLISGGIFSGISTATMDGWSVYRGRKVRAEGNSENLLAKISAVQESVLTTKGKNLSAIYNEMLDAKNSYDALKNKDGDTAALYLGRMETLRLRYETQLGVQACMSAVQQRATPESAEALSALLGRTVTVEDIRENKNDAATVAAWYYMANLYLSDRDTREDTLSNRAVEAAYAFSMPEAGQEAAFITETGVSVPVAAVEGGYRVGETVYPSVKEARNALISAARTAPATNIESDSASYSLPIEGKIVDARTVTEQDVRTLLENVKNGEYRKKTYIPLRVGTPQFLVDVVTEHSQGRYKVDDLPMVAEVEHLIQIMEEDDGGDYGDHRPHGLDVDDIIKVLQKMGDPSYIVLQENGRYAEVVSFYNSRNKQVIVSIDFADSVSQKKKNYKHREYMNGYAEGYYNVIVTQYEPDNLRSYLQNNEVVYDKKKMNGSYQVGSGRIVAVTHDTPFITNSILDSDEKINPRENFSLAMPAEGAAEAVDGETESTEATQEQESAPEQKATRTKVRSAEEQDRARAAVPGFDTLGVMTKERIYEFIASSGKMSTSDVDAVCQMMAARPGLSVLVSDKVPKNGLHYIYPDGRRLILLSRQAEALGRTTLHEIVHDLEGTAEYDALVTRARKNKKALAEAEATVKELEENYAGREIQWTDERRESETNAELVSGLLTSADFLSRYAAENKGGLRRVLNIVKRFVKSLPTKKGKIYRAADRLFGLMEKAIEGTSANRAEGVSHSFKGRSEDGRGIYESNFPKGTPKSAKSERILSYIQNVWSKKPIDLVISNGETSRVIAAQFDPTVDETKNTYTDADKIAGGNKQGRGRDRRVMLDLADDYYQIASEAKYDYSKEETGKDTLAHKDVKLWHYFVNDILFSEYGETEATPYTVTINVKEKNDGSFVYSYSAERTEEFSTRRTLLAAVNTRKGANGELFIDSIPDSPQKSNPSEKKSSQEVGEAQFSLAKSEDGKAHPYTKRGAEIVRGLAVEKTGITLNRQEAEALDDSIYFAANIAYPGGVEAAADAAAAAALTELRKLRAKGAIDKKLGDAFYTAVYEAAKEELPNHTMTRTAPTLVRQKAEAQQKAASLAGKTEAQRIGLARNRLIERIGRLKEYRQKMRKTGNILESQNLDELVRRFEHLKYGASLRVDEVHEALGALRGFFGSYRAAFNVGSMDPNKYNERPIEEYELPSEIVEWTEDLYHRPSEEPYSVLELEWLAKIVGAVEKMHESFYYMKHRGNLVEIASFADGASQNAKLYGKLHKENKDGERGFFGKAHDALYGFVDPVSVVRMLDSYDKDGVLTDLFTAIREGESQKRAMYADLVRPFEEFLSQNKGYRKRLKDGTVTFRKKKISIDNAIALSLTFKREQALDALLSSTITIRSHGDGEVEIPAPGVALDKNSDTYEADRQAALKQLEADIAEMEALFSPEDRRYMDLLTEFYNKHSKDIKQAADEEYMGFSNVVDSFYYPITRGAMEKNLADARAQARNLTSIYSLSFNKSTVESFRQLDILPASETMLNHANGLSSYAKLYGVLKNYDRVMNYNVGSKTNIETPRLLFKARWKGFDNYMTALLNDVAGVQTQKGIGDKFYDWFTGTFVSSALGLNLKTNVNQFGAIFAAGMHPELSWRSLAMALTVTDTSREEMCNHSIMAKERSFEPTAVMALSDADKLSRVSEFATRGITLCDEASIYTIWKACLRQMSDKGLTGDARLEAAGKLLDDVIRETQQSADKSGRYAFARSKNPLFRAFTIFTSDKNKIFSRLFDGVGHLATLNAKKKEELEVTAKELAEARRQLSSAGVGFLLCAAFSVAVVQIFRFLYNEDDNLTKEEQDSKLGAVVEDLVGAMVSVIPLADKMYSFFTEGYTISHYFYDQLNDVLQATKKTFDLSGALLSGEHVSSQELSRALYNTVQTTAAFFGIPVRNVKNTLVGIVRRISPAAAYEYIDSKGREMGTEGDLRRALKSGNEKLAEAVIRVRLRDRATGDKSTADRLLELYEAGYTDILPKSIPEKITSAKDYRAFRKIYEGADEVVLSLLESDLEGEELAAAVKAAYSIYYKRADTEVAGGAMSRTVILSKLMDVDTLVYHTAMISAIKSREGENAKAAVLQYLKGTNLSEEEKNIILYGSGYTAKEIRAAVKKAANGLTSEESAYLFKETYKSENK